MTKVHRRKAQSGYALLLMVLAFMGLSGAVAVGFTQQARQDLVQERFLHNQRVLREAKAALLQYAYNYPEISFNTGGIARGPGRLPCADTDNDGDSNTFFGECDDVGRLPWAEPALGLNDLRDADGQRLWYTVSSTFATNTATIVNSNTSGTLTVRAPSGNVMYDGSNPDGLAKYGIAAVIIAPGATIDRAGIPQDRSISNGDNPFDYTPADDDDKDTDPGIIDPVNYLDLAVEDNATVTQGSDTDGFLLGSTEFQSNDNVNDQFILITAEEVTRMAEKAVLEAYRTAIDAYQFAIWGATETDYRYPWINAYASITDLNIYDMTPGTTVGRVPFLNFYTDLNSHTVITDMSIVYDFDLDLTDTADPNDPTYLAAFNTALAGGVTATLADANLSFSQVSVPGGLNSKNDDLGAIVGTGSDSDVEVIYRFFWDGCAFPCGTGLAEDGWELCDLPATSPEDCALNSSGTGFVTFTAWANHADIKIRRVGLNFTVDSVFEIGLNFNFDPASTPASTWNTITAPTAGANARREAVIDPALVTDFPVDFDGSLLDPFIEITAECEQDNFVGNDLDAYNAYYLGNENTYTAYCTPTLSNNTLTLNQLDITTDYYPELPAWVRANRWNDSILLAYADDYKPGGNQDCVTNPPCLTVTDDFDGFSDNNISVLLNAGRVPATFLDLPSIFEGENSTPLDNRFSAHPDAGDDTLLILDES